MWTIKDFDLFGVLAYLFLWATLYFLLCLWNSARSYEWHCRMVTVFHAVTVSAMAMYSTVWVGPSLYTAAGGPNSPLQIRIVSLSLGYFLFDMCWCCHFKTEGVIMMMHHVLCILGLSWCLIGGYYGTEVVATVCGGEITNPLLQLRWFLRETGYYKTILGDVTNWMFMLSFGVIRIGLGSRLLYLYYQQDTDFWGRFGCTSIYIISWVFFINILSYAARKYVRRYSSSIKNTSSTLNKNHCKVPQKPFSSFNSHKQGR